MSSSALTVYPDPPPTTNALDSQQRTRLMRSTRKLGAILGATPYVLEDDTSFMALPLRKTSSRASKRQGCLFTHHQISSSSIASSSTSTSSVAFPQSSDSFPANPPGLPTARMCRSGDKLSQPRLRLDTVPVPPTDECVASPLSPCSPPSPVLITPTIPDVGEIRRKRMAKLTRHLGENIPVSLVLAAESIPRPATSFEDHPLKKRSQSICVTTEAARVCHNRPFCGQPKQDWVGEWNRSNIVDVQKELRNLRVR